jgi:arylsulfatase A-like enzyme
MIALSDHGFAHTAHVVNVAEELVAAGLMDGAAPQSVVFAANGQAVSLYVERRDPQRVRAIAEFLQRQPWAGAIFTAASAAGGHEGVVPGTLALEYVHVGGHERSPDIVLTFRWSDEANVHRVPGADYAFTSGRRKTGPVTGARATHGGLSPWTVRNVMIASGPDFQRAAVVATPSSNVDIAPTLLHLLGLGEAAKDMDGRVLVEALAADAGSVHMPAVTRVLRVHAGGYRAALQITEYAGKRYVDKAWRE